MRPVPQVRTQNAYNCGSYSLWMALESLTGQDDALIKKIEDKAVRNSDSMGGIFNYVQMERIIEALGYSCRRVKFHDVDSMNDALDNHTNDAIIIAYCYDMLFGGGLNGAEAGDSAHWSVLTGRPAAGSLSLANPHGELRNVSTNNMMLANKALKDATFNWRAFVEDNKDDALFKKECTKYKNNAQELTKRGRMKLTLGGYLIAVTK